MAAAAASMAPGELRCVVVAVDGSETSMCALRWALDNLSLSASSFVVLHAQPPPSIAAGLNPAAIPFGGPSHVEVPAFAAAIEAHQRRVTEAILSQALKICAEKNVSDAKTEVVVGEPKYSICDFVIKVEADLLVMGSRAHGPIKRMFLGSVSDYCINTVHCPVVVIKGSSPQI